MSRPVASVRPIMSTPVPLQHRQLGVAGQLGIGARLPNQLVRPGVTVQQVKTTTGECPNRRMSTIKKIYFNPQSIHADYRSVLFNTCSVSF